MSEIVELKKTLKKWEASFFLVHLRKPNKVDIDASGNIKEIYEQYSKLKRHKDKETRDKTANTSALSDVNKQNTDGAVVDSQIYHQPESSTSIKSPIADSCSKPTSSQSPSSESCSIAVLTSSSKSPVNDCIKPVPPSSNKSPVNDCIKPVPPSSSKSPVNDCIKPVPASSSKSPVNDCIKPVPPSSSKSPDSDTCTKQVSSNSNKTSPCNNNKPASSSSFKSLPEAKLLDGSPENAFDETDGDSTFVLTPADIWGPALNKDLSVEGNLGGKIKEKKEFKSSGLLDKLGQKLFKNEQRLSGSGPEKMTVFGSRKGNWSKPRESAGSLRRSTSSRDINNYDSKGPIKTAVTDYKTEIGQSESLLNISDKSPETNYGDPIKTDVTNHSKIKLNQSPASLHKSGTQPETEGASEMEYSSSFTATDKQNDETICKSISKISSVYDKTDHHTFKHQGQSGCDDDVVIPKQFRLGTKPSFNFNKIPAKTFQDLDEHLELEEQIREESLKFSIQKDKKGEPKSTDCAGPTVSKLKKKHLKKPQNVSASVKNTRQTNRNENKSEIADGFTETLDETTISGKESSINDPDEMGGSKPSKNGKTNENVSKTGDEVFDVSNIGECESEGEELAVKTKPTARKRKRTDTAVSANKKLKDVTGSSVNKGCDGSELEPASKKPRSLPAAPKKKPKASGDNFVRLNMKVKRYIRKDGRHMSGPQFKRKQWKDKMKSRSKSYGDKCFICNKEGHWSRNCPDKKGGRQPKNSEPVQENDFPSILEAAGISRGNSDPVLLKSTRDGRPDSVVDGEQDEMKQDEMMQVEMSIVRSHRDVVTPPPSTQPWLSLTPEGQIPEDVPEMYEGLKMFGFDEFRPGQEQTVKRILAGLSTLVVLSTGGGKSLCYQLPAYLYAKKSKSLTVVVSPLVSLMEDQVTGLPAGVRGVCLHSNMTKSQREGVLAALNDGSVHFLLVSPEAVVGGGRTHNASFPPPDKLPPIPFVCIDEAHCLSEWSHNFRPSYLRLCKVLRQRYGVKCFLGLTATATKATAYDVSRHLGIEDVKEATIRGSPIPKNLVLSVSRDENRDEALMNLLQGERFTDCDSVIVYCTRREEANRVATLLRTCLQKPEMDLGVPLKQPVEKKGKKGGRRKKSLDAESYHAGLTPCQRKRVQKDFMSGQLRIVVATVAFGMGLDKADVRAVIHYNMPKSFESYVQEIGRAGRDGNTSHCHVFLDPQGKDLSELRRHTFSNSVDRYVLKKLVQRVFKKCRCQEIHGMEPIVTDESSKPLTSASRKCPGHERALDIQKTVHDLDIREEGLSTLLCYLELHPYEWVENLQPAYSTCRLQCYGGPPQLQAVSKKCPPVAVAIAKQKMTGETFSTRSDVEFDVFEVSDSMGWDSGPVKRELKLLQWNLQPGGASKTGVMVEFSDLAFHFRSPGDLTEDEMDDVIDFLHHRAVKQEKTELFQLDLLHESLISAAHRNYWMCCDEANMTKSNKLRGFIEDYFENDKSVEMRINEAEEEANRLEDSTNNRDLDQLVLDVRQFVNLYGEEHTLNGRVIARVFHGIASPCFPSITWGRVRRFWRSHLSVDFNKVLKLATQELIRLR